MATWIRGPGTRRVWAAFKVAARGAVASRTSVRVTIATAFRHKSRAARNPYQEKVNGPRVHVGPLSRTRTGNKTTKNAKTSVSAANRDRYQRNGSRPSQARTREPPKAKSAAGSVTSTAVTNEAMTRLASFQRGSR